MELSGKVAIVTGGASGLGMATVECFIRNGAKVAIFDLNEDTGAKFVERLGKDAKYFNVNVADETAVQSAIDQVVKQFGAIHICCNFAGIGPAIKTYGKNGVHPLDKFQQIINVNLIGTFNVLRLCAERMAQNEPVSEDGERGVILNTASVAAYDGQVGQAAYSASKGGIISMTLPIARDLVSYGIRVNTIVPGLIGTPLLLAAPDNVKNSLIDQVQFPKRFGKPEEIARLAKDMIENAYMNGECIRLDGGIRMSPR